MMTAFQMVPTLTSLAGSCLTMAQWQECGIHSIALEVTELLIKPGLEFLSQLNSIKQLYTWSGEIILNARGLSLTDESLKLRSPYDGSLIVWNSTQVMQVLEQIKPDRLIRSATEQGYLQKDIPLAELNILPQTYSSLLLETNKPAQDGLNGQIYSLEKVYSIFDQDLQNDYEKLDETCSCIICKQTFTRAYFHHLAQQTPLLAQRLMIQHNVTFYQNYLARLSLRHA